MFEPSTGSLRLIRAGTEPLIQVFVHGFLNGDNDDFNKLYDHIIEARPAGRVYLYHWGSGSRFNLVDALRFPFKQNDAARLGASFRKHVAKITGARQLPMNLIGHSLGARLIHWALAHHEWEPYLLRNVVLMGSAASRDDDDWAACADEVSGVLVNAWSDNDMILALKGLEAPAGRGPLDVSHPKVRNINTRLGHLEYWPNLEWVLAKALRSEFVQYEDDEAVLMDGECPYCGRASSMLPGEQLCSYKLGGCGLWFEFRKNGHAYIVNNDVVCPTRGCREVVALFVSDPEATYECRDCGGAVWAPGTRVTPARQVTE